MSDDVTDDVGADVGDGVGDGASERGALSEVVEDIARWFEDRGLPRTSGRVIGWLLVCDPPEQSQDQIAEALSASRGGVSQAVRSLEGGLIERVTYPGDRATYYRVRPDWGALIEYQIAEVRRLAEVTDRALETMAEIAPDRRDRLDQVRDFAAFWARHLPSLLERWRDEHPT